MADEEIKDIKDFEDIKELLLYVYKALEEKGYNPIAQLMGYLCENDAEYITVNKNARNIIRQVERDEIMEELLRTYFDK